MGLASGCGCDRAKCGALRGCRWRVAARLRSSGPAERKDGVPCALAEVGGHEVGGGEIPILAKGSGAGVVCMGVVQKSVKFRTLA